MSDVWLKADENSTAPIWTPLVPGGQQNLSTILGYRLNGVLKDTIATFYLFSLHSKDDWSTQLLRFWQHLNSSSKLSSIILYYILLTRCPSPHSLTEILYGVCPPWCWQAMWSRWVCRIFISFLAALCCHFNAEVSSIGGGGGLFWSWMYGCMICPFFGFWHSFLSSKGSFIEKYE